MKTKLSKKRAISTVLTTVIILVSSVVLGSGVVLYGTSLFQGASQTESISVSGIKLWVHDTETTGIAWGAASVRNDGDSVLSVDKISVRGSEIPFSQWYVDTTMLAGEFGKSLTHAGWAFDPVTDSPQMAKINACVGNGSYLCIDQDGSGGGNAVYSANVSASSVALATGGTAVIYFKVNNGTLTPLDSGASTTVIIQAGIAGGPQSITIAGQS